MADPRPPASAEETGRQQSRAHRLSPLSTRSRPRRGRIAIGSIQLIALLGVIGLAVIAGAILVEDTSVPGWIDGLAIGAGSVLLTLLVVFNGRRARRP